MIDLDMLAVSLIRRLLWRSLQDWDILDEITQKVVLQDVLTRYLQSKTPRNQAANFVSNYVATVESYSMWQDRPKLTFADIWNEWGKLLNTLNYV